MSPEETEQRKSDADEYRLAQAHQLILDVAQEEMNDFRKKYEQLDELDEVFAAMDLFKRKRE